MSNLQRSFAFFTLLIVLVLEIVDLTIVNTALPTIERELRGAGQGAQWIVAGYSLSFSVLLILGGRLGDIFGGRSMFLVGVGGFTLASLWCGLAVDSSHLIAARVAQGAMGALMAPQVMTMIQIMYSPTERIGRMVWFGIVGGISAIIGPLLGGALIAANAFGLGWRSIFLINCPIGIIALIAGVFLLPRAEGKSSMGVDLPGTALFGGALLALLYPLLRGENVRWSAFDVVWFAAAGMLALAGWARLRRRVANRSTPAFDPSLFHVPTFWRGALISLIFSVASTGFLFVFALSMQRDLSYSALQTGMLHVPFSAGVMFGMAFIGRVYLARLGKWVLVGGTAAMAIGCTGTLGWAAINPAPVAWVLPCLFVAGIGMGLVSGPIGAIALAQVKHGQAGSASGILKTVQQMGAALGVALCGTAYFASAGHFRLSALTALGIVLLLVFVCAIIARGLPSKIFSS